MERKTENQDPLQGKLLLNVKDVATALSLAPRTIYNELSAGTFPIPVRRRGKLLRFKASDVREYVESL